MLPTLCILVASFPWEFGAYQQQAYALSQKLTNYNIQWMAYSLPEPIEERIYTSVEDMYQQFETIAEPPVGFQHSHLTFVGHNKDVIITSHLNTLATLYNIDLFLMVGDVTCIVRDANIAVPAVLWFPHHYQSLTTQEQFTLAAFGGIVSLSKSSARMIATTLERPVVHIPHIVEVNTTTESKSENFSVLMQGGNYDTLDRKGWNIGIQAFQQFHVTYPDSHLYLHGLSSLGIMKDGRNVAVPLQIQPTGLPLQKLLTLYGLDPTSYTLDERMYTFEESLLFKKRAHVCLHPSRVEGFGMNVLECQMVGTPVVTTNFTAMADFTEFGIAVPYEQLEFFNGQGLVAMPSVRGTANALEAIKKMTRPALVLPPFNAKPFASTTVAGAMDSFLQTIHVPDEPLWTWTTRANYTQSSTVWTLVSESQIEPLMITETLPNLEKGVLIVVLKQTQNPLLEANGCISKHVPVLVRTHYLQKPLPIELLLSVQLLTTKQIVVIEFS